jgi:hypothetical protein
MLVSIIDLMAKSEAAKIGPPKPAHLRPHRFETITENDGTTTDWLVVRWGGYDYSIEMSRIGSPAALLGWLNHMLRKNWDFDPLNVVKLIGAVANRKGWDIYEEKLSGAVRKRWVEQQRGAMTPELRWKTLARNGFRCVACGRGAADGVALHVDHASPVGDGGGTTMTNLQTLCEDCNLGKRKSAWRPACV